jgi:hypothetical protein
LTLYFILFFSYQRMFWVSLPVFCSFFFI